MNLMSKNFALFGPQTSIPRPLMAVVRSIVTGIEAGKG
jgi:hypothetical protein